MSDIGALVDQLIEAGTPPGVAARIVAEAFSAGSLASAYRIEELNQSFEEKRRERDRIRKAAKRAEEKPSAMSADKAECPRNSTDGADKDGSSLSPIPLLSPTPPNNPLTPKPTSISEANASAGEQMRDFRAELFGSGLKKLATISGKGPDACRSFAAKCLKLAGDDAVVVLGLIEDAERNQAVDPSSWIMARLQGTGPPLRATTVAQKAKLETKEILDGLERFASGGSGSSQANSGLLPGYSGERSDGVRGGFGPNLVELPAGRRRESG